MNARAKIVIERNQKRSALSTISNEPKPMCSVGIIEHEMTSVVRVCADPDWQQLFCIDDPCGAEICGRGCNDDGARRKFRAPQRVTVSGVSIRYERESSTPSDARERASGPGMTMCRT